jgi:hypothetical protein
MKTLLKELLYILAALALGIFLGSIYILRTGGF